MKSRVLASMLSGIMLLGTEGASVYANGFFQENKGDIQTDQFNEIDASYQIPQDNFILDEKSPHNFYNPYKQPPPSQNITLSSAKAMNEMWPIPVLLEPGSQLIRKSEQAIRLNALNVESSDSVKVSSLSEKKSLVNGIELSELTSSTLILSARKKQYFEKILPVLLSNHRIIYRDRERLEALLSQFDQGSQINEVDELWLKQMAKKFYISEILPLNKL